MRTPGARNESWIKAAMVVGGWTVFGLFFASQTYLSQVYWGRAASWTQALWIWMPCGYSWAALTPVMLGLARRFPFARHDWLRPLFIHSLAAISSSFFAVIVYVLVRKLLLWNDPAAAAPVKAFQAVIVGEFHVGILIYGSVIGISYALSYYRKYREREMKAARLESQLAQARLDALRKQLQPHFLFNTLNTVAILIDEDAQAARNTLVRLSDLLRATLDRSKEHEVSLQQELEFIKGYLEIERTRFQDRLTVKIEIDPKALNARVPDLILQPIVENAIRHGVAPRSTAGLIEIRAECLNGSLRLQVRDNGKGLPVGENGDGKSGVGIANTRARLAQLYGVDHGFDMRNLAEGGLLVNITI
ncbi:MAG TPA: histidine kinase, partial [Blastocatellia bacterium]|nr:histidine kinase [Blastocatellia bacterium]